MPHFAMTPRPGSSHPFRPADTLCQPAMRSRDRSGPRLGCETQFSALNKPSAMNYSPAAPRAGSQLEGALRPLWDFFHYIRPGHHIAPMTCAVSYFSFDSVIAVYVAIAYGFVGSAKLVDDAIPCWVRNRLHIAPNRGKRTKRTGANAGATSKGSRALRRLTQPHGSKREATKPMR